MVGLAFACGGLAFAAALGSLLLAEAGISFALAVLVPAVLAGVVMFLVVRRWHVPVRDDAAVQVLKNQISELEASSSALRHDLRGVLSPALMMADRLVDNPDPAVRRAGNAVVRSVDRATALLTASKAPAQADSGSNPA